MILVCGRSAWWFSASRGLRLLGHHEGDAGVECGSSELCLSERGLIRLSIPTALARRRAVVADRALETPERQVEREQVEVAFELFERIASNGSLDDVRFVVRCDLRLGEHVSPT